MTNTNQIFSSTDSCGLKYLARFVNGKVDNRTELKYQFYLSDNNFYWNKKKRAYETFTNKKKRKFLICAFSQCQEMILENPQQLENSTKISYD